MSVAHKVRGLAAAELYAVAPTRLLEGWDTENPIHGQHGSHQGHPPATLHAAAASALVDLLEGCLREEPDATTDAEAVVRKYGHARGMPVGVEAAAVWDLLHREVQARANEKLTRFVVDQHQDLFRRPPLIESLENTFRIDGGSPLEGADVLACQHLMASSATELKAIQRSLPGLNFVEVLGKPYSTNRLALLELAQAGFLVNEASCEMADVADFPFGSFAQRHRSIAADCVRRYVETRGSSARPLLILDDGGALINAVGQAVLAGLIHGPVVAVEQTTHGLYAIDRKFFGAPGSAGFAVISMAESLAKLGLESPLIAESVIKESTTWLDLLARRGLRVPGDHPDMTLGVVGFGVIGAAVAKNWARGEGTVAVFDRNRHKIGLAHSSNLEMAWSLENLLQYSATVIGASGGSALDREAAKSLKDRTILLSASSGDKEFRGIAEWDLDLLPVLPHAGITPFDRAHGLIRARYEDRQVFVVNRGFPVNFDGSFDSIPLDRIQLTRALMFGAVLQAGGVTGVTGKSLVGASGVFDYDEHLDKFLAQQFGHEALTGA